MQKWNTLPRIYTSHYRWFKNGLLVGKFRNPRYEHLYRGLIIEDVKTEDAGNLTLHEKLPSKPSVAEVTSFNLKVPDTRLHLVGPNNITVYVSDRIALKVKAEHSGSSTWYFEDQMLQQSSKSVHYKFPFSSRYGFLFGSILEIHNIQRRHSGRYRLTYFVSGCQRHIDITVHVFLKDNTMSSSSLLLSKFIVSAKRIGKKMNTNTGKIIGIVALVIVVTSLVSIVAVSGLSLYEWCRKKKTQYSRMRRDDVGFFEAFFKRNKENDQYKRLGDLQNIQEVSDEEEHHGEINLN